MFFACRLPKNNNFVRAIVIRDPPKTVVIALGGNALLRDGEICSQEVQGKNIAIAAKAIAKIAEQRENYNVVLTHGNGPQVGFLANQQGETTSFNLDVLNAETQGMIGMQIDNHLESLLPGRDVTTLLTQVEVDIADPAFKNPTKPIGPSYPEFKPELAPMVQVQATKKWRRVVASPNPKKIMEMGAIKSLVKLGYIVICCGGGGVPVVQKDNSIVGVEAVIDKDRTSALLATEMNADIFIMLTDTKFLYKDWGKPTKEKVTLLDVANLSQSDKDFIKGLEAGSMRPKVESGIQFAQSTKGWAAIGAMEDLELILAGKSGTRIQKGSVVKVDSTYVLPEDVANWNSADVSHWLSTHLRLHKETVKQLIDNGYNTGPKLATLKDSYLQSLGLSWMTSSHVIEEIESETLNQFKVYVESQPYRWPYNRNLNPHNTALVIIDMQRDFLEKGGYISEMGYSLENGRAIIPALQKLLAKARKLGFHIIHTREGHRPSLGDCPPVKHWRSLNSSSFGIGDKGPLGRILVKGEPGWEIIHELAPLYESEIVIDKPGKGSFVATDLELILDNLKISNLIITGVTTDVCVHTTLREANDRGFECLLVTDACAALDKEVHNAAVKSVQLSGGIFGATADTRSLLAAFDKIEQYESSKNNV